MSSMREDGKLVFVKQPSSPCQHCYIALLVKLFEPMTGPSSIVFANEEDWQMRQKCLYHTLEGTNLKSYFANFVSIIKVRITSHFSPSLDVAMPLMMYMSPVD